MDSILCSSQCLVYIATQNSTAKAEESLRSVTALDQDGLLRHISCPCLTCIPVLSLFKPKPHVSNPKDELGYHGFVPLSVPLASIPILKKSLQLAIPTVPLIDILGWIAELSTMRTTGAQLLL